MQTIKGKGLVKYQLNFIKAENENQHLTNI